MLLYQSSIYNERIFKVTWVSVLSVCLIERHQNIRMIPNSATKELDVKRFEQPFYQKKGRSVHQHRIEDPLKRGYRGMSCVSRKDNGASRTKRQVPDYFRLFQRVISHVSLPYIRSGENLEQILHYRNSKFLCAFRHRCW